MTRPDQGEQLYAGGRRTGGRSNFEGAGGKCTWHREREKEKDGCGGSIGYLQQLEFLYIYIFF